MRSLESRIAALELLRPPTVLLVRLHSFGARGEIEAEARRITTGRGHERFRNDGESEKEFIARAQREDAGRHAVLVIDNGSGHAQ